MTANHYERILRERDELTALLAAEKATRNSIIEKGVKTERERDEVNSELNKKYVEYDQLFDEAEKIKIERDEARHKLELCMAANSDVARIAKERDEAREALMQIEDLFIDGTDIYADREKMGTIARAALEGAQ